MKYIIYIIISVFSFATYAQDTILNSNSWLLSGAIFKMEAKVAKSKLDIQKIQKNNLNCDVIIQKSEAIISQAQQQKNAEAEQIAQKSFQKATDAKKRNLETIKKLEESNANAENAIATVKKEMLNKSSSQKITSVISNFSGNVQIKKANLEKIYYLDKDNPVFLEEGDLITTGINSKVEMKFLDGRGNVNIGESSNVKMNKDSDGTQFMSLIKGKVNIVVDKIDEYQRWIDSTYKKYNEINKPGLDDDLNRLYAKPRAYFKKKFEVRRGPGCGAIRGTQLIVSEDAQEGMEIIVLEGSVEMKGNKNDKTVIVNEGYKGVVTSDGQVLEPEKIDISKIEKWWEK